MRRQIVLHVVASLALFGAIAASASVLPGTAARSSNVVSSMPSSEHSERHGRPANPHSYEVHGEPAHIILAGDEQGEAGGGNHN